MSLNFGGANLFPSADDSVPIKHNGVLTIPSCMYFSNYNDTADVKRDPDKTTVTDSSNVDCLIAPIQLPHGATMTSIVTYGDAGLASQDAYVVQNNATTGITRITGFIQVNTKGAIPQGAGDIDNENYYYQHYVVTPSNNDDLYCTIIEYVYYE